MAATLNLIFFDITPAQLRAARALLDWSQDRLALASGMPKRSIVRFESGETMPRVRTIRALKVALEEAGIEFMPSNGSGPGVRLRTPG